MESRSRSDQDNGPELTSRNYLAWAIEWKIDLVHIRPGKPTQNGGIESFNSKLRDECLNTSWFWNVFDARRKISAWKMEYNSRRPHSSLGYLTPNEFARQWQADSLSEAKGTAADQPTQGNPDGLRFALALSVQVPEFLNCAGLEDLRVGLVHDSHHLGERLGEFARRVFRGTMSLGNEVVNPHGIVLVGIDKGEMDGDRIGWSTTLTIIIADDQEIPETIHAFVLKRRT
jgi:hypothetical protein